MRKLILGLLAATAFNFPAAAQVGTLNGVSVSSSGGCTIGAICQASKMFLGGYSPDGNALGVTGAVQVSSTISGNSLVVTNGITTGSTGILSFGARGLLSSPSDGAFRFRNNGATNSADLTVGAAGLLTASGPFAATTYNGNTLTTGTFTLTGAASKTLTFNNSLTLAGTDATTLTFPTTSATIARTDAGQTFTGTNVFGITQATSLALGGATIGANALAVTGATALGGGVLVSGGDAVAPNVYAQATGNIGFNRAGGSFLTSPAGNKLQLGGADVVSPTAQTFQAQGSRAGTDSNVAGANFTITSGAGTGNSAGSSIILQAPLAVASGTGAQTQTTFLTGTAVSVTIPLPIIASGLGTDAGTTDSSLCLRADTKAIATGTGTLGICLGTSSARYKHDIAPLGQGLVSILALKPVSYRLNADRGDPTKLLYGFTAEDMAPVIPALVGLDAEGRPNSADYLGLVPVLVKAVQELQAEVDTLRAERALTRASLQ